MSDDKIKKEKEKYIERCIKNALNSTFSNSATKKRFKVVSVFKMKNLFYCVTKEMQEDNLLSEGFNIDRIFLSLDNSFTMEIKSQKELEEAFAEYKRLNEGDFKTEDNVKCN